MLVFVSSASLAKGSELEIEYAAANTTYGIGVHFGEGGVVGFGNLATDNRGHVKVEFEDSPELGQVQINNLLPDGKDVRDIQ